MNNRGIAAIKNEAARLGWPVTYHTDVDRDCAVLSRTDAPTCFGWAVRISGTLLALPNDLQDIRICEWWHACSGIPHRYYWFDGTELTPLSFADFRATLEAALLPAAYVDTPEYAEVVHRWQRHHAGSGDHDA